MIKLTKVVNTPAMSTLRLTYASETDLNVKSLRRLGSTLIGTLSRDTHTHTQHAISLDSHSLG